MKTTLLIFTFLFSFNTLANWSLLLEEDGIEVYSGEISTSGIIPFKASAEVNAPLKEVVRVLKNYKKKHLWSPKLKSVKMHKELGNDEYIFSEYYKTPWPAADREFLLEGKVIYHSEQHVEFFAKSIDEKFKHDGHIQADVKYIIVDLKEVSPEVTQVQFSFHGDMKGWMPVWLINLIQKKWPMRFIQGLRKQVLL